MNELHLFAGIGGGIIGGLLLGHRPVCAVEIKSYCRSVLLQRQRDGLLPRFPIWDDVRTFDGTPWRGRVDIVCGGFPCQDISAARTNNDVNGQQRGLEGEHSGLWYEMVRVIKEVSPAAVFIENSPNLRTKGLHIILQQLDALGYNTRRCVVGSKHIGADHCRERMWILAYTHLPQCQGGGVSSRVHKEVTNAGSMYRRQGEPQVERTTHGFPRWMDELRAIGNAQDPRVVELAWRILTA
jgi:DNA (cytosine-5)-methyltransferase 1